MEKVVKFQNHTCTGLGDIIFLKLAREHSPPPPPPPPSLDRVKIFKPAISAEDSEGALLEEFSQEINTSCV
jgi:hypothetical protein